MTLRMCAYYPEKTGKGRETNNVIDFTIFTKHGLIQAQFRSLHVYHIEACNIEIFIQFLFNIGYIVLKIVAHMGL